MVHYPAGERDDSLFRSVRTGCGDHSASFSLWNRGSFPDKRRLRLEVDHLPTFSAKVMFIWSCNSTPSHTLMPATFICFLEAHREV
jgi:hypothetical protein